MPTSETQPLVPVRLARVIFRERAEQQWIFLEEVPGSPDVAPRGFPIVIGTGEASEIHRVVTDSETARPLTHQLALNAILALGSRIVGVDIVDLRANTFYAEILLTETQGGTGDAEGIVKVDARPSDALALALRSGAPIRVAESVLEEVRTDQAKDVLPEGADPADYEINVDPATGQPLTDEDQDPFGSSTGPAKPLDPGDHPGDLDAGDLDAGDPHSGPESGPESGDTA